jgi:peptidoglycan hydrolase-like protein with peptidoglycan-binding domain
MTKIFAAGLLAFGLVVSLPVAGASGKTSTSAKKAVPAKTTAKAKSTVTAKSTAAAKSTAKGAKAKTTVSAKSKKPAPTHYAQQRPTTERYTQIQQALVERGYLPEATGDWGPESVEALKKFQAEQRLPSDGKLGSLSLRALGLGARKGDTVEDAITAGVLPASTSITPAD